MRWRHSFVMHHNAPPKAKPAYRRLIEVRQEPGATVGHLEDFHHHFMVRVDHDGSVVHKVHAQDLRAPWTTCAQGSQGVRQAEGLSLPAAMEGTWAKPRRSQCVHSVDLAMLVLAHANDRQDLHYEVKVVPPDGERRVASLVRNGRLSLRWILDSERVLDPPPFAGCRIAGSDLVQVAREAGDPELVEGALVLRRACHMARSVLVDLDRCAVAADARPPDESCFTYRASVALGAARRKGTSRSL